MASEAIVEVPLEAFDLFVNQSRERFDEAELAQLAENIRANGLLQPGVAAFDEGRQRYVLICGERRYRALKLAGLPRMAVKVVPGNLTQGQMLAINLAENLQRASLNAIERAKAFQKLMRLENLTASEAAARMNVSNATVSRDLSLLDLPETLQQRVISGELPSSVAATIARVGDDDARRDLADRYAGGLLARHDIEAEVGRLRKRSGGRGGKPLRLKLGGVSLTVSGGKQPVTLDMLIATLTRLKDTASELKKKPGADIAALATSLKAS